MPYDGGVLDVPAVRSGDDLVLRPRGELNLLSYGTLRDALLKAAVELPRGIVVLVDGMQVHPAACWSLFPTVQWQLDVWPAVPIVLICVKDSVRDQILRSGIEKYVAVFRDITGAQTALAAGDGYRRRRVRIPLFADHAALSRVGQLLSEPLRVWELDDQHEVLSSLAEALLRCILGSHTDVACSLRVECDASTVTVAVTAPRIADGAGQILSPESSKDISRLSYLWGHLTTADTSIFWATVRR